MTQTQVEPQPTREEFVGAAFDRIEKARGLGRSFMATAIRVELLTMWDTGARLAAAIDPERPDIGLRLLNVVMAVRRMIEDGHPDDPRWFRIIAEQLHTVDDLTDAALLDGEEAAIAAAYNADLSSSKTASSDHATPFQRGYDLGLHHGRSERASSAATEDER